MAPPRPQVYEVYLLKKKQPAPIDPDMPGRQYETAIFVKTDTNGGGYIHQAAGDIDSAGGMSYERTKCEDVHKTGPYHFELLGVTDEAAHPRTWIHELKKIPTPPQQKAFNVKTGKSEPFKTAEPLVFYEPGETRRPLVEGHEWILQAITALRNCGLIR